jgi:hypothetical protein
VTYRIRCGKQRVVVPKQHVAGEFDYFGERWFVHRMLGLLVFGNLQWLPWWRVSHVKAGCAAQASQEPYDADTPEEAVIWACLLLCAHGRRRIVRALKEVYAKGRKELP